ncbi:Alg9-like mannosyltransferase family-domain-containing protein [Daedaleopsis nitida]|nr:Alg9-like mannosyltransferase family-domain-containing protein [Daedaleopsis nitida]
MSLAIRNHLRAVYLGLVLLRCCFAVFGTGYIHPDEYFQNGEATAGRILGLHTLSTWEWDPIYPCRSIVPPWVTTGLPFSILRLLFPDGIVSSRTLFVSERLSFLSLSFLLDYAIYHLVHESARSYALILLGSSYIMHTYQVRPFTNSIESILVALSLLFLRRMLVAEHLKSTTKNIQYLALLAFVAVNGIFTRITFAAFFLPVAVEALKWSLRITKFAPSTWAKLLLAPATVAALTALGFVYADSIHFVSDARATLFEFTPWNLLQYNLLPENLAEHGLHPRWLHLVVNLPMVATPPLLVYSFWAEWDCNSPRTDETPKAGDRKKQGVVETMQKTLSWVRWSGTTLLSIQPHQEPRFLIPLVAPMVALVVNNGRVLRAGKLFGVAWVICNILLAVLFGVLHQGGVVPSLFRVHDMIYDDTTGIAVQDFSVVYWKTYMPQGISWPCDKLIDSKTVTVTDLAGASVERVLNTLGLHPPTERPLSTLLVAPFHSIGMLESATSCLKERGRVSPHLDLDHIGEAVGVGWSDGLSLGIFEVDRPCLDNSGPVISQ